MSKSNEFMSLFWGLAGSEDDRVKSSIKLVEILQSENIKSTNKDE